MPWLSDKVMLVKEVRAVREKIVGGQGLSLVDSLKLIGSHEELRATALVKIRRVSDLEKEVEALRLELRRSGK